MPDIFIVDDSISVRKALEITLRNHSLSSQSAVSGEQALETLGSTPGNPCDLLMVDVIMPGMSGIEFCTQVKTNPRYAHLPVILMSGNVDEEVRFQASEAGASGVLKKPFRSEELIPMVQDLLRQHRTQNATVVEEIVLEDTAAPENAAPTDKLEHSALSALSNLLQTYEDHPRVRDVVILDRQGQPIKQTGNMLPENIQMFARFFTNTAGVLGKQMLGEDIQDITIRYGGHEMVIHSLPTHFVVVLMGGQHAAGRVVN